MTFTGDPDYEHIVGLFEKCMQRHDIDTKIPDFIWNKNKLAMEKEAMKAQMLKVLNKKPGNKD